MSQVAEPATGTALPVTRPQLRRAQLGDAARLASLFSIGGSSISSNQMAERLEHGGALFFEDDQGPVSALCWQETSAGWKLSQTVLRDGQSGDSHGRWLMTQVESLAIRLNIPWLSLDLADSSNLDWYRRLGYEPQAGKPHLLAKKVGGTWPLRKPVPA